MKQEKMQDKCKNNNLTFAYKVIKIQNVQKAWFQVRFILCITSYLTSSKMSYREYVTPTVIEWEHYRAKASGNKHK